MFSPLPSASDGHDSPDSPSASSASSKRGGSSEHRGASSDSYVQLEEQRDDDDRDDSGGATVPAGGSGSARGGAGRMMMHEQPRDGRQTSATGQAHSLGLELSSLRAAAALSASSSSGEHASNRRSSSDDGSALSTSLMLSMEPSASASSPDAHLCSRASFESLSSKMKALLMEDASETQEEELEMMDYDNPEDHILERRLDEDGGGVLAGPTRTSGRCGGMCRRAMSQCGLGPREWRKLKLTSLRMGITILIGVVLGCTGFGVSRSVSGLVHFNVSILATLLGKDQPAAAFFALLLLSCLYTGVAALLVTFGSWQTRGSGVGRLNAYLSGMSSSRFLALKTLFVKILGLVLSVSAGIKQGMEGPFIHIGAMVGLHVSRLSIFLLNLFGSRFGVGKYTSILGGVVDERMFISSGAAAGFSVAFNAPIAGVLYVQDGAFAYWQGEYTIRTFLCTMTAVTTINMCWKEGSVLPSRGLIDIGNFLPTTITLQEFWGFIVLGILGGLMGVAFTKINVMLEKFRAAHLAKLRLPNLLDVLACTVLTVLLSFILPFMLPCHERYDDWCALNPYRCIQFHCGPGRYSDLGTFFFTLPEETIRILFDRTTTSEATIPYQVLLVFVVFYFAMACVSYGMAVPGGLFIPSIVIGAAYGRLVGMAVQALLPAPEAAAAAGGGGSSPSVYLGINPGVYAVLGSASMLGGITRMTLPISVMLIEITSDAQFLIPIMLVVLLAKVVADFGTSALYTEHLALDGLVMVFGDRPPAALRKLQARDVCSHGVRGLAVVSSVESAWGALKETGHNAFPVTDSALATLKSIVQKRRAALAAESAAAAAAAGGGGTAFAGNSPLRAKRLAKRSESAGDEALEAKSPSSGSSAASGVGSLSTGGNGVFLGLIQRRHLVYVLSSMPCFPGADLARDSEPMTALPYELALASAATAAASKLARAQSGGAGGDDSGGLEVVPLSASSPPNRPSTVSHAMMHSGDSALLNEEGANASASFVEWCARQGAQVGQNMEQVAATPHHAGPTPDRRSSPDQMLPSSTPAPHHRQSSIPVLPSSSPSLDSHGHGALGQDLSVQSSLLSSFVNLSPFIDQGAYTVSENISARRVWALFRSLGMRHIVVLNHQHQPVGVITRRDLIRFAKLSS